MIPQFNEATIDLYRVRLRVEPYVETGQHIVTDEQVARDLGWTWHYHEGVEKVGVTNGHGNVRQANGRQSPCNSFDHHVCRTDDRVQAEMAKSWHRDNADRAPSIKKKRTIQPVKRSV